MPNRFVLHRMTESNSYILYRLHEIQLSHCVASEYDPDNTNNAKTKQLQWSDIYLPLPPDKYTANTLVYSIWPTGYDSTNTTIQYTTEYYYSIIQKIKSRKNYKFVAAYDTPTDPVVEVPHSVVYDSIEVPGMVQPIQCNENIVQYSVSRLQSIQDKLSDDATKKRLAAQHQPDTIVSKNNTLSAPQQSTQSITPIPVSVQPSSVRPHTPTTADFKSILSPTTLPPPSQPSNQMKRKSSDSPAINITDSPALKRQAITPATHNNQTIHHKPSTGNIGKISVAGASKQTITPLPPAAVPVVKKQKSDSIHVRHDKRTTWQVELPHVDNKLNESIRQLLQCQIVSSTDTSNTYTSVSGQQLSWTNVTTSNDSISIHPFVFIYV